VKGPFKVHVIATNDESHWEYIGLAEDVQIGQKTDNVWSVGATTLKDINLKKTISLHVDEINPVTFGLLTGISEEEARKMFEKGMVHHAVPKRPVPTVDLGSILSG